MVNKKCYYISVFLAGTPKYKKPSLGFVISTLPAPRRILLLILICCKIIDPTPKKLYSPTFTSPDILTAGINVLKFPIVTSCPKTTEPLKILKSPIVTLQVAVQLL